MKSFPSLQQSSVARARSIRTPDNKALCGPARGASRASVFSMAVCASALLAFSLVAFQAAAQENSGADSLLQKIKLDSSAKKADTGIAEENTGRDSVARKAAAGSAPKKARFDTSGLVNIVSGNKKIRAYGWGEYRVNGRCLCCDNVNDGDCIYVQTVERTDRERIPQIVDGKIEGDINDKTSYFGGLEKRDQPKLVELLMAEISLGKMHEVRKVAVYTITDREKRVNFLSNCDLGYYDQFGRLLWAGKAEKTKYDEPITFELEKPVLTNMLLLRVDGGKNRITEVTVFSKSPKQ